MSKSVRSLEIQRDLDEFREAEVDKFQDCASHFNYDYLEEHERKRETIMYLLSKRIASLEIELVKAKEKGEQRKRELSLIKCYIDRDQRLLKESFDFDIVRRIQNLERALFDDQAVHAWKYTQEDLDRLKKLRDGPWETLRIQATREIEYWQ